MGANIDKGGCARETGVGIVKEWSEGREARADISRGAGAAGGPPPQRRRGAATVSGPRAL